MSVALERRIFDVLHERHQLGFDELRALLRTSERGARAVLGVLVALGYLHTVDALVYMLTDTSKSFLVSSSAFSWKPFLLRPDSSLHKELSQALDDELVASRVLDPARAMDAWESGEVSLEQAREFCARMHAHSLLAASYLSFAVDFKSRFQVSSVLDVGGGSGCFMIALAQNQGIRCGVGELAGVVPVTKEYVLQNNVQDLVEVIPLNMFRDSFPKGYESFFFSNVFHDWSVEECRVLAKRTLDALPSRGKILLHEMILDENLGGPKLATFFSMHMFVHTKGQQFSLSQLRNLLESVGFVDVGMTRAHETFSLVYASKP